MLRRIFIPKDFWPVFSQNLNVPAGNRGQVESVQALQALLTDGNHWFKKERIGLCLKAVLNMLLYFYCQKTLKSVTHSGSVCIFIFCPSALRNASQDTGSDVLHGPHLIQISDGDHLPSFRAKEKELPTNLFCVCATHLKKKNKKKSIFWSDLNNSHVEHKCAPLSVSNSTTQCIHRCKQQLLSIST